MSLFLLVAMGVSDLISKAELSEFQKALFYI